MRKAMIFFLRVDAFPVKHPQLFFYIRGDKSELKSFLEITQKKGKVHENFQNEKNPKYLMNNFVRGST